MGRRWRLKGKAAMDGGSRMKELEGRRLVEKRGGREGAFGSEEERLGSRASEEGSKEVSQSAIEQGNERRRAREMEVGGWTDG